MVWESQSWENEKMKKSVFILCIILLGMATSCNFGNKNQSAEDAIAEEDTFGLQQFDLDTMDFESTMSESSNWNRKYFEDDFGEEILTKPYIDLFLDGNIAINGGDFDHEMGLHIVITDFYIRLSPLCDFLSEFYDNERITVKLENGDQIPILYEEEKGKLYIDDESVMSQLIQVFEHGNFTLAIAGINLMDDSHRCIFRVFDETRGVKEAMKHLESSNIQ